LRRPQLLEIRATRWGRNDEFAVEYGIGKACERHGDPRKLLGHGAAPAGQQLHACTASGERAKAVVLQLEQAAFGAKRSWVRDRVAEVGVGDPHASHVSTTAAVRNRVNVVDCTRSPAHR
jgi:hypothetical protein